MRRRSRYAGLLNLSRSVKRATRFRAGMLAVLEDVHAVHKYIFDTDCELVRIFIRRAIGNRVRIEHNDVGKHSFFQETSMMEAEVSRG